MHTHTTANSPEDNHTEHRAAYTLAEVAKLFGRTTTWAHRLHYAGKIRVITGLGRKLVPRSEIERIIAEASPLTTEGKE